MHKLTLTSSLLRLTAGAALVLSACSDPPSAPSPAATIRIGPNGPEPRELRIKIAQYVAFVNTDVRPHTIASDPVDEHSLCPPVNRVGLLQPGETRETGTLTSSNRTCSYHDHSDPSNASMRGRIVVE